MPRAIVTSWLKQYFAEALARLDEAVSFRRVLHCEGLANRHFEILGGNRAKTAIDSRPQVFRTIGAVMPARIADDRAVVGVKFTCLNDAWPAAGIAIIDVAAEGGEYLEASCESRPGDGVEDEIDALAAGCLFDPCGEIA